MKRFFKSVTLFLTIALSMIACFSLTGCRKIKTLDITVSVRVENEGVYSLEEKTLSIDLYSHLADKTVDAIISYANEGYYNGTFFYQTINFNGDQTHNGKLMIGDLKFDENTHKIVKNSSKPNLEGQFAHGGTIGSVLSNTVGSIGLWRSWNANDSYSSYNQTDTGSSTLFFPISDLSSSYDDCFCVIGLFDTESESNSDTWSAIKQSCSTSSYYDEYVIYYTGSYSTEVGVIDNGLTFNCIEKEDYDAFDDNQKATVFEAKGNQLVKYNATIIRVPVFIPNQSASMEVTSKILSISVR